MNFITKAELIRRTRTGMHNTDTYWFKKAINSAMQVINDENHWFRKGRDDRNHIINLYNEELIKFIPVDKMHAQMVMHTKLDDIEQIEDLYEVTERYARMPEIKAYTHCHW